MWQTIEANLADEFIKNHGQSELLETTAWLNLQKQFYPVERLAYYFQGQLVAVAIFIQRPLALGYSYFYSPRGPIFINNNRAIEFWPAMLADIKPWLLDRRACFWRIEPASQPTGIDFQSLGLQRGPDIQPSQSLVLDIGASTEAILKQMHHKTRYNIRLAEKRGVVVEDAGLAGMADFWRLMQTTGQRDGFHLHGAGYYQALVTTPFCRLLVARRDGQALAAGIFGFWGNLAVYLHGASDNQHRELMAPYLVQWQAIQLARQHGCRQYDFFGISQSKWPGVTRFKQGFGGTIKNYCGTLDWPTMPIVYRVYKAARQLARRLR